MNAGPMKPCSKIKLTCSTFVLSLRINRCLKYLIWDDLFRSSSGSMNASHLLINTRYALYSFRPKASTGWETSWWLLISSHGNEKNPKLFFLITKNQVMIIIKSLLFEWFNGKTSYKFRTKISSLQFKYE